VHLGHGIDQGLLVGVGELRRRYDAPPVGEYQVDAGFLQGWGTYWINPLGSTDGQHPNLAGLDLVEELTKAGRGEGDLAAENRRQQVAATVVGDEELALSAYGDQT
jgi:hypothetical protein